MNWSVFYEILIMIFLSGFFLLQNFIAPFRTSANVKVSKRTNGSIRIRNELEKLDPLVFLLLLYA